MRSRIASAVLPANAIRPPLHSVIARSAAGIAFFDDRQEFVAARNQPAVARRIAPAGIRAPRPLRRAPAPCAVRAVFAAAPAACRRTSPGYRRAWREAPCAPPAPRARCRAAAVCSNIFALGASARASRATASWPGPTTTAMSPPPAFIAAPSTCASSVRPPTACSTFGQAERMRVPSPAASTIARHVRRHAILLQRHRHSRTGYA